MQDAASSSRNVIRSVTTVLNDATGLAKIMAAAGYPRIPVLGDRDFYQLERLRRRIGAVQEAAKFGLSIVPFLPHIIPHMDQPEWVDSDVLGVSRGVLKKFGLTKTGWKYLLTMPPQRAWMLSNVPGGREGDSMRGIVRRVQALTEIGVWPKKIDPVANVFERHLLEHEYEPEVRETLLVICKRMWDYADTLRPKGNQYREFLGHTFDVIDWFDRERPRFDKNQKNSSWETIYGRAHAWHVELRQRLAQEATERQARHVQARSWGTLLDRMETIDGFEVVPLVTEIMLHNEGRHMGHCVGGYAPECRRYSCRIFSIRKHGESKATVQIGPGADGGAWRVRQNRGPDNAHVSDRLSSIGKKIATDWNRARQKGLEEFFPQWADDPRYLGEIASDADFTPGR